MKGHDRKEESPIKKWFIRMMESGYDAGSINFYGTLEGAKKLAKKWASEGNWLEPVVEVRVQIWDKNPYEAEDAKLVEEWRQYSYDSSKPDPYREAEERYRKEHENDACPACGARDVEINTPGLGGMDSYFDWREVEPYACLGWCRCPACGQMWGCVGEEYVQQIAEEISSRRRDC